MTVTLSDVPGPGDDLEDYVAALFQSSGYFVEKRVVERDPDDVLELDIVATDYHVDPPLTVLAEVKGGGWGFPDVFKLVGWMQYLALQRGAFFVSQGSDKNIDQVERRAQALGVTLVHLADFGQAQKTFETAGFRAVPDAADLPIWRFAYLLERRYERYLSSRAKSDASCMGAAAALEYHRLVNNGIFFEETTTDRLRRLYEAYMSHPRLALSCALEAEGEPFAADPGPRRSDRLAEAMQKGTHPLLQATFYIEHRARLAILKAAVDYLISEDKNEAPASRWDPFLFGALPLTFQEGVAWLRAQPTYRSYALLWQQFLWGWGGFYLEHQEQTDFAAMGALSGVPTVEVPTALEAFDRFFPNSAGWFVTPGWTQARRLKMMPVHFHGVGVHHRRAVFKWDSELSQVEGSGYTRSDLARWNNAAVAFLT